MMSAMQLERLGRAAVGAGLMLLVVALVVGLRSGPAAASAATLTLQPAPGAYHSGESIDVSVGPNSVFAPNARIVIIECAAPGGQVPIDDSTCDGNTVQGDSVLVGSDGSFTEPAYTLYALPSTSLNEQANHLPVCNATSECVLYIGEDQNDFTKPKIFSPTFTVTPAAQSPAPSPGGGTGSTATTSSGPSGAGGSAAGGGAAAATAQPAASGQASGMSVTLSTGSLAFTGPPIVLPWLVGAGAALLLVGTAGGAVARRGL
jgi:hypothetical protein